MLLKKLMIAAGLAGTLGTASLAQADDGYHPRPVQTAEPPYYGNPNGGYNGGGYSRGYDGWRAEEHGWRGDWRRDHGRHRVEWERYRRWRRWQWMRMHGYGSYGGGW